MERTKHTTVTLNKKQHDKIVLNNFRSTAFLPVSKILMKQFGLIGAGILGNYIDKHFYFEENHSNFNGWFYLTFEKQTEELGVHFPTLKKWKDFFIENQLISEKWMGVPGKLHFKINAGNFNQFITAPTNIQGLANVKTNELTNVKTNDHINNKCIKNTYTCAHTHTRKEENLKQPEKPKQPERTTFDQFWDLYPRKVDKGKTLTAWNRVIQRKTNPVNWKTIKKALLLQIDSERWQNTQFIPHPTTWLNQSRWLDNPEEMISYSNKDMKTGKDKPEYIYREGQRWYLDKDDGQYYSTNGERYEE